MIPCRNHWHVKSNQRAQSEGRFRPYFLPPCQKPPTHGVKVGDDESFYTTFLHGTVGVLSLDALELSPVWDGGSRGLAHASSGSHADGGESAEQQPLLGNYQWKLLSDTLEKQVRARD